MSIIDGLLKLDGSDGSLKKMTASEENYLAHQSGLQLADAGVGEVASITTTSSGNATVGTYTNTTMDGNVGDHDASARNVTTTNTVIYQVEGTAATSGGSYFQPVIFDKSDTKTIKVVNDTEMAVVVDRLLLTIFANDYAGTYKLGSSAPSSDYSAHISNVFSDTRADGTTVNYSIYKRDTFTEPTKISPMRLLNSSGDLQAMTPTQIKYTFGQVAKTRIMNGSAGVGTYQLRSSAQGVPTDSGTWVAKGTATDIRNTLADQNYTRDSTDNFAGNYSGAAYQTFYQTSYQGEYDGNYSGQYVGNYLGNYDGSGDFTRNALETYSVDYDGNYDGASSGFETAYVGNYEAEYVGNFIGNYDGVYQRTSTRTSTSNYTADYGGYTADYTGTYEGNYDGEYDGNYTRDSTTARFIGNYVSNFTRTSTRAQEETFTRQSIVNYSGINENLGVTVYSQVSFQGDFVGTYTGNFVGDYANDYIGDYIAQFLGNFERVYTSNYIPTYVGTYSGQYVGDYTGNYEGGADYIGGYAGNYDGEYIGDFIGDFTSNYVSNYTADYSGDYTGNFVGNYAGSTIQSGVQTIETYTLYVRTA